MGSLGIGGSQWLASRLPDANDWVIGIVHVGRIDLDITLASDEQSKVGSIPFAKVGNPLRGLPQGQQSAWLKDAKKLVIDRLEKPPVVFGIACLFPLAVVLETQTENR